MLRYVYVMFGVMCNVIMCNVGQSLVIRLVWPEWRHKMWNRDGCYDLPWLIIYLAAVSLIEICDADQWYHQTPLPALPWYS